MRLGVSLPHYRGLGYREPVLTIIDAAEALGFDSIWTTDHVVVPRAMPEPYGNLLESLTVLAVAAGRTTRVGLGTSVIVLPQRETILLAKQVATLHHLSAGRMMLGVGVGWLEREFVALGADFASRGAATSAAIDRLRGIWGQRAFDGDDASMSDLLFSPANTDLPPIPILVGGNSGVAVTRAAAHGDGWHAINRTVAEVRAGVAAMRSAGVGTPVVQLRLPIAPGRSAAEQDGRSLDGDARAIIERIGEYERAGVQHITVDPLSEDLSGFLADLRWIADQVLPHIR